MRAWIVFTVLLLGSAFTSSATTKNDHLIKPGPPFQSEGDGPVFFIDYANYLGDGDSTYVEFYFQIGYNSLQFIRNIRQFLASYQLRFLLQDTSGVTLKEYEVTDSFKVASFDETKSRTKARVMMVGSNMAPGVYSIKSILLDHETNHESVVLEKIRVRDYSSQSLQISDIQLSQKIMRAEKDGSFVKNQRYVEPNAVRVFTQTRPELYLYFEIYNLTYTPLSTESNYFYSCDFILTDENGIQIARFDQVQRIPGRTSAHSLKIPLLGIPDGKYTLKIIVVDEADFQSTENVQQFTFVGMPLALAPEEY